MSFSALLRFSWVAGTLFLDGTAFKLWLFKLLVRLSCFWKEAVYGLSVGSSFGSLSIMEPLCSAPTYSRMRDVNLSC
jgi:hypothetical protein